jgi:SAM-dependent methyltransferase
VREIRAEKVATIARCPNCYEPVEFRKPKISCTGCGAVYTFEQDCPVLMRPEDHHRLSTYLETHASQTVPAINSRLRRLFYPPGPCYDPRRSERLRRLWSRFGPESIIIDVGAQNKRLKEYILTLDLAPFDGVDLVGNALRLPIEEGSVDLIINTGVLEHVEEIETVVAEFYRVLRPGGVVYTEIPFMQGYHPDPTDFQRLTYQGLARTFKKFEIEEMEISSGPFSNLAWTMREVPAAAFNGERAFTWIWMLCGWLSFWLKYLDKIVVERKFAHRVASSYYVTARKE